MSCLLSTSELYNRTGFNETTISPITLNSLLSDICHYVKAELDETFETVTVSSNSPVRYVGTNLDTRKIGFWQEADLNIKLKWFGSGSEQSLVKDRDYRLEYYRYSTNPNFSYPVFAVRFFAGGFPYFGRGFNYDYIGLPHYPILTDEQYIEVDGTKGMDGMPSELKNLLYQAVADKIRAVNYQKDNATPSSYYGEVKSLTDLTSSVSFGLNELIVKNREALVYDIMQSPIVSRLISNIKRYSNSLQASILK